MLVLSTAISDNGLELYAVLYAVRQYDRLSQQQLYFLS